jgi:hypothetical protein
VTTAVFSSGRGRSAATISTFSSSTREKTSPLPFSVDARETIFHDEDDRRPGDRGGGVLARLRPLHRAQSVRGRVGRWSSAAAYACGAADALLAANPWYEALAADAVDRQARRRAFVLGEDPKEAAIERQDWLIGSDAFRIQAHCEQARTAPRTQGRPLKPSGRQGGEGETAGTLFS